MLKSLYISNIVLIEQIEIDFEKGLNVLTGETGAGKSILIHSLNFLSGTKADKSLLRDVNKQARVQGVFTVDKNKNVLELLKENDIELENGNEIIVERVMSQKQTSCRINGVKVPLFVLKDIVSELLDIYGQNENIKLLDENIHLDILDSYDTKELSKIKNKLKDVYGEYKETQNKMKKFKSLEYISEMKDLYEKQIKEIDNSNVYEGEEEKLKEENEINQNREDIISQLSDSYNTLSNSENYDENISAVALTENALSALSNISNLSSDIDNLYKRLESVNIELQDVANSIQGLLDFYEYDEERVNYVNERLNLIFTLKDKYKVKSIKELLKKKDEYIKLYDEYSDADSVFKKLDQIRENQINQMYDLGCEISKKRQAIALKLEKEIERELKDLKMDGSKFKVVFEKLPNKKDTEKYIRENGFDKIEFMISTNVGHDLKKLTKIISGGEMSRFMLAVKKILVSYDDVNTLIFDEIDTGIGGKVALSVAKKLVEISKNKQILVVTHLAQIAASGNNHLYISKFSKDKKTFSKVEKLNKSGRIKEIARLTSGDDQSQESLKHAEKMLKEAVK